MGAHKKATFTNETEQIREENVDKNICDSDKILLNLIAEIIVKIILEEEL